MKVSSHLPAYEDGTDRVFRNVGIYNSDARELPKRKHNIFRTRRKFEIKNLTLYCILGSVSIHALYRGDHGFRDVLETGYYF